ncbi:hypothetical protein [Nostoc sp.]|uniref:hypothetical protein n=1 Tax=Nostoc sp. TaxID=1180 RepID=UPI002FF9E769
MSSTQVFTSCYTLNTIMECSLATKLAEKLNNRTVSKVNTTAELGMLLFGDRITINLSSNFTQQIEPTRSIQKKMYWKSQ